MSMEQDTRIKQNVFEEPTTYLNDFRPVKIPKREYFFWPNDKSEPPKKPPPPFLYEDHEIFEKRLADVYTPFNLLLESKAIVGQNPFIPPPTAEVMVDAGLENAIKTRPRLYMSPAVSIDDTPDPEMRKLLCQFLYSTEWTAAAKQAALKPSPKPPIKLGLQFLPDPRMKIDESFPVPPEWIEKFKREKGQKLSCDDPTVKPTIPCDRCKDVVVSNETKQEVVQQPPTEQEQKEDELMRQAVNRARKCKEITHPLLTTYQVMCRNVDKECA